MADFPSETVVAYTRDEKTLRGKAAIYPQAASCCRPSTWRTAFPHNFIINIDHDGNDTWVATGQGSGLGDRRRLLPGPQVESRLAGRREERRDHRSSSRREAVTNRP